MSYIDINGARTFYEESGQGPPIVFVHGWSMNHSYWRAQVEYFSRSHRTIVYDWRGMGATSGGEKPYRFAQLVDDLAALLQALRVERPALCGHSLGGDIVLQYGISRRDAGALVVVDAPGPGNLLTSAPSYALLQAGSAVAGLFIKKPLRPFVCMFQYLFFSKGFQTTHPDAIGAWKEQFVSNSRAAVLNAGYAQAYRENPLPRLSGVAAPALIVRGSEDKLVPQREVERYLAIPGSRLFELEGAGHSSMVEQPGPFNETMAAFLAGARAV